MLFSHHTFLFRYRFGLLLASQFGLLLIAAFLQESFIADEFFLIILSVILFASAYALEETTKYASSLLISVVSTLAANIYGYAATGPQADIIAACFNLAFLCWSGFLLFQFIFRHDKPSMNTIMGAASLYIMIGVAFGFLYMIIDYIYPHSFHTDLKDMQTGPAEFLNKFLYFSFITQTTVGYGDITPISQQAKYLAVVESLISQLYLTILLARLVGLHLSQKQN